MPTSRKQSFTRSILVLLRSRPALESEKNLLQVATTDQSGRKTWARVRYGSVEL